MVITCFSIRSYFLEIWERDRALVHSKGNAVTERTARNRLEETPRYLLCALPTPVQRAQNLEAEFGEGAPRIWIKRDDLTGLAYGGNKARKLEYLIADALASESTVVVTQGNVQSNHARMTAAAAALAGMKCVLVLDARGGVQLQGNLLLDHLLGADVRIVEAGESRGEVVQGVVAELTDRGERPYVIGTGGSTPLGALGYVRALIELTEQLEALEIIPTRVYTPTSSQGTLAGLAVGASMLGRNDVIQAIAVEGDSATLAADAAPIATGAAELIGLDHKFTAADFAIDDRYVGEGYGIASPEGMEAIALLARTEALVLEPTYTGKGMAGLIGHIREGRFGGMDDIVFIHTGGGPAVFARAAELAEIIVENVSGR